MARRTSGTAALTALLLAGAFGPWQSETGGQAVLRIGQPAPEITGGPWINSKALSLSELRGRVVLVEFWTYG